MTKKLLFIFLCFVSCQVTEKSVVGTYQRYWDFENHTTITLNPNNAFEFSGQDGLMFLEASGNWKLSSKYVYLDSYPDTIRKSHSSVLINQTQKQADSIKIKVSDENGQLLPGAIISIYHANDSVSTFTDINGVGYLAKSEFDSLQVSFIGFNLFTYKGNNNYLYQ